MTQILDRRQDVLSVIIAARNEQDYINACLDAVLAQDADAGIVQMIISANACSDDTVSVAHARVSDFAQRHWELIVLDRAEGGKIQALNAADAIATGHIRIYLDADVICEAALLGQLRKALSKEQPLYGTGTLDVAKARTWVTRAYAHIWTQLPFVKGGGVGAGLFAVNKAGRERWDAFPDIISDDTYVRMQFAPHERVEVKAKYMWPMVEGFSSLVRVRRRQDAGVAELHVKFPEIVVNEGKSRLRKGDISRIFLSQPVYFVVYFLVHIAVRLKPSGSDWTRGR